MTKIKEKIPYKIRTIRISDEAWNEFKKKRWKSNLGWDKFIKKINNTKLNEKQIKYI